MSNILYIVVPCYNEQEVLPETSKRLRKKVQTLRQSGKIDADSRILFVNDGSKDATWEMIQKLHEENSVFSGVEFIQEPRTSECASGRDCGGGGTCGYDRLHGCGSAGRCGCDGPHDRCL